MTIVFSQSFDHVLLIGVDGMSPNGIENADTPVMDKLMKEGLVSFTGKAVLPTSSAPNWASMFMGCGPEIHGIKSNSWRPRDIKTQQYCNEPLGQSVPTIFKVLRRSFPKAKIGCFHDWFGIRHIVEPGYASLRRNTIGPRRTTNAAIRYTTRRKPMFTFVHLDHVDHAGHAVGHGTPTYYEAVEKADHFIGVILKGLEKKKMLDRSLIIISSDHGGKGKGHGGDSPEEVQIPIIIYGKGISSNHLIKNDPDIYDIPATIVHLLGAEMPACWVGENLIK